MNGMKMLYRVWGYDLYTGIVGEWCDIASAARGDELTKALNNAFPGVKRFLLLQAMDDSETPELIEVTWFRPFRSFGRDGPTAADFEQKSQQREESVAQ